MIQAPIEIVEINHAHLYCGLGGGAKGFNRGKASVGPMRARFRCLGGIDVSPAAIRDFERLAGVPGTCMDLMDREQYLAFHGQEPPAGWREAVLAEHIPCLMCRRATEMLDEQQARRADGVRTAK